MEISTTLVKQLGKLGVKYETVHHDYSRSSLHSAHSANIPVEKMVKSVVLEDDQGFVMALVPANQYVKINEVNMVFNRRMGLATEDELEQVFSDCDQGAIPPIGDAYGMTTVIDYMLDGCDDVYIESGNHKDLLHVSSSEFKKLIEHAYYASICVH